MPIKNQPCYLDPALPIAKMMKAMIEMGDGVSPLLGQLLASIQPTPIPLPVLRYVFGPLIVHVVPSQRSDDGGIGWLDRETLRRWRPRVSMERLEILCGERPDVVSPTEIMLVMNNATHEAPLHYEPAQIYCWASMRAFRGDPTAGTTLFGEGRNQGLLADIPSDDEVFNGRFSHEYRELCREIVAKVISHSKIASGRRSRAAAAAAENQANPA